MPNNRDWVKVDFGSVASERVDAELPKEALDTVVGSRVH